jgi:hypothetical protein
MRLRTAVFPILAAVAAVPCIAGEPAGEEPVERHRDGSTKLAVEQDELSADVQQLILEQTIDEVIRLLEEVEFAMDDATDNLELADTGGETIAAQTDVIEKIYEAAKARQSNSSGDSESSGAMMDMLERMMGRTPDADQQAENGKPRDTGGQGVTGDSDTGNEQVDGSAVGKVEERRVPKASGKAGREVPEEFREALDAFNRGSEQLAK